MADRRVKIWFLLTLLLALLGVFGFVFLAGAMARNDMFSDEEEWRGLRDATIPSVNTSTSEYPPLSMADNQSHDATNASVDDKDAVVVHVIKTTKRAHPSRLLETDACTNPQPYMSQCFERFTNPLERTIQRLADAVGHLEIEEDDVACTGVLLDSGASKTSMYFVTAASCLPNKKHIDRVRIHFTGGCIGTNTYTKNHIYMMNRRLGYVILRIDTTAKDVRASYGFLRLRGVPPPMGEPVFLVYYADNQALKRITLKQWNGDIMIREYENNQPHCDVASPKSRISYKAPMMDRVAIGAPVISLLDGKVVALHLCGICTQTSLSNGLVANTILVDLDNNAKEIPSFSH